MIPSRHTPLVRAAQAMAIGLLCHAAQAQEWEVFDMALTGFPSNTVRAIAHDSVGGTWVGTDWGLCHQNGTAWEVLQTTPGGLPENDIRALACDGQGRIWVGLFTQGLAIKDGAMWTHYNTDNSPMPSNQVRNITFDQQGAAWISTTNGLVWTDLTDWHIYDHSDTSYNNQQLPGVNISDVAVRADGLVCIGTLNAGFTYLTDTLVRVYTTFDDYIPDNTALGVAIDSQGDRWTVCPFGGLVRYPAGYNSGLFFQYSTGFSGIPSNALTDIVIDGSDRKLIATQAAGFTILSADNSTWTTYNVNNSPLPGNELNCVSLAPDGSIWLGTALAGVVRMEPSTVGLPDGKAAMENRAWPNPFKDYINFQLPNDAGASVWRITDPLGRTLQEGRISGGVPCSINVSGSIRGLYLLTVINSAGVQSIKMVRQW